MINTANTAAITSSATPNAEPVTADAANADAADAADAANADTDGANEDANAANEDADAANADAANADADAANADAANADAANVGQANANADAVNTDAANVGQADANADAANFDAINAAAADADADATNVDAVNIGAAGAETANASSSLLQLAPSSTTTSPSIAATAAGVLDDNQAVGGQAAAIPFPPSVPDNNNNRNENLENAGDALNAQPPQQTPGTSGQLGAQATQTSATAIVTSPPVQQAPNNPDQPPVPSNPQSTDTSSTVNIIGSAFGPRPTTSSTAPSATQDNNRNQNGNLNNIIAASNPNSDLIGIEPIAQTENVDSGADEQGNAAETVPALPTQITQDSLADVSNPPPNDALDSAADASDPSRPSISGLGKEFIGTTDAAPLQPTNTIVDGPGAISSASAVIGATATLITNAVASGRPTGTINGRPSPTGPVTKETAGGLNAISRAFSNPVTRTKSIGILVAVIVSFIVVVALILFLWWFMRRKKQQQRDDSDVPSSGDGEKGGLNISGPINSTTQEDIANYDPSAELMGNSAGLDYGPSQPSQLDNALMNRASRLSNSRKSFLDIYGGTTPYPQDVVDGNGRPLTQQFLMPQADKFQLKGLGPMSPFAPRVPGVGSAASHQRNISTASRLSNLPSHINPDLPAPTTDTIDEDPFADEDVAPLAPLGAARIGTMKSQNPRKKMGPKHNDSWMTVNSVAGGMGQDENPSRTDYTSVYMRNPFIDPPEASGGAAVPAMPAIPKHLQSKNSKRNQQTESVTLMFSPNTANLQQERQQPQAASTRPLSGPGETEVMYSGVLDDYPPRPPSTQVGRAYGASSGVARKSNPFDLEVKHGAGAGAARFRGDGTGKSMQSWLTGVEKAERHRMENENVI